MIDKSAIKLIIWDLDDTFWRGTLSEGGVKPIKENVELLKSATKHGVVNSICSKNTYDVTIQRLQEMEVLDYFVFPSIDWTPKGERIKRILKAMGLRPQNTLFLDDNPQNLSEALHYSPALMTGGPELISELVSYFKSEPENDTKHKRLNQYKILEKKEDAKEEYSSNEDFLYACNLHVEMDENCESKIERIAELVQRANQLNYTKVRSSKEDLKSLIKCENIKAGCVSVKDKFGDYGMVGFYAIDKKENLCVHFLFSCRTIGQGVEQYVYAKLGYPKLNVVGEVINMVDHSEAPKWINQDGVSKSEENKEIINKDFKILFKGPCDLLGITNFLNGKCHLDEEFTYVGSKGNLIESHNHSVSLEGLIDYTIEEKAELLHDCDFLDEKYWESNLFKKHYDIIFLSTLMEPNVGLYKKKNTRLVIPFGEGRYPLTDSSTWEGYLSGKIYSAQNKFSKSFLEHFSANYEYIGITTPPEYIERLEKIIKRLGGETKVCLILGSELPYENNTEPAYENRHLLHRDFNNVIKEFASKHSNLLLLDLNTYIHGQGDFNGNINHFTVSVYYKVADKVVQLINELAGSEQVDKASKWKKVQITIITSIKSFLRRKMSENNRLYEFARKLYRKIK